MVIAEVTWFMLVFESEIRKSQKKAKFHISSTNTIWQILLALPEYILNHHILFKNISLCLCGFEEKPFFSSFFVI